MNAGGITADTALPGRYGEQAHYPQVRSDAIVTMPGPDDIPLVFPTLCGAAYARRPRDGETTQLALCTSCAELQADQRADQHRSSS